MTRVDVRGPKFPDGSLHDRSRPPVTKLPSIVASSRGGGDPVAASPATPHAANVSSATSPPPNVIPFTKPRAIAAIAAANPHAVVTMSPAAAPPPGAPVIAPFQTPIRGAKPQERSPDPASRGASSSPSSSAASSSSGRAKRSTRPMPVAVTPVAATPVAATTMMTAPPVSSPPEMPAAHVPSDRLSTGWTPPHAVKVVAQPASVRGGASPSPVTAWPAPVPVPAQPLLPPLPAQPLLPPLPASMVPAHTPGPGQVPPVTTHAPMHAPAAPAVAPAVTTRPAVQMPIAAPMAEHAKPWGAYEQLGLGAPKPSASKGAGSQKAANLVVNAYRLLGFGILTVIVIVLVGYIASTVFYYFSDSWIVPMAVSPTDEKVVSLQAQLAEQQNTRDKIADELQQAERAIAAQQTFQAEFAKAIRSDLEGRKLALGRIRALATAAAQTRTSIKNQNTAYANAARRRMAEEYAAGLIDRNGMLSGKFQIAQITSSNLTLAERQAEFETRAAELEAQTRSLDAILSNASGGDTALSYEVLRIKQELESSRLDLAKSIEARDTLKAALARQDKIVGALKQSAYLRAIHDKASVAFVPYGNLDNASKGTSLYGCKLGMLFCYRVGEVLEVVPGEVQFKHPHRDKNLRGQLVVLKLDADEAGAAADDVLFAGGRPLLF